MTQVGNCSGCASRSVPAFSVGYRRYDDNEAKMCELTEKKPEPEGLSLGYRMYDYKSERAMCDAIKIQSEMDKLMKDMEKNLEFRMEVEFNNGQ